MIDKVLRLSPKPGPTAKLFIKSTAHFLPGIALRMESHFNFFFLEYFSWRVKNNSVLLCDSFMCSLDDDEEESLFSFLHLFICQLLKIYGCNM